MGCVTGVNTRGREPIGTLARAGSPPSVARERPRPGRHALEPCKPCAPSSLARRASQVEPCEACAPRRCAQRGIAMHPTRAAPSRPSPGASRVGTARGARDLLGARSFKRGTQGWTDPSRCMMGAPWYHWDIAPSSAPASDDGGSVNAFVH